MKGRGNHGGAAAGCRTRWVASATNASQPRTATGLSGLFCYGHHGPGARPLLPPPAHRREWAESPAPGSSGTGEEAGTSTPRRVGSWRGRRLPGRSGGPVKARRRAAAGRRRGPRRRPGRSPRRGAAATPSATCPAPAPARGGSSGPGRGPRGPRPRGRCPAGPGARPRPGPSIYAPMQSCWFATALAPLDALAGIHAPGSGSCPGGLPPSGHACHGSRIFRPCGAHARLYWPCGT